MSGADAATRQTLAEPAVDRTAGQWRDHLLTVLEDTAARDPVVLQSGGMDSLTVTAGLLTLGCRPQLVTFTVGGSRYSDLARVERLAAEFDLPLHVVDIPRTEEQLIRDIVAAKRAGATRKTHIQCHQPIAHMARHIRSTFGPSLVTGGLHGIVEDSRQCMVTAAAAGEDAAREIRARNMVPRGHPESATRLMYTALVDEGHTVAEPYATEPLRGFGLSLDLREINCPRQKGIALRAFPGFFRACPLWAKNSSMQVGSGIRAWHDTLLQSTLNPDGRHRSVVGIYNRMGVGDVA